MQTKTKTISRLNTAIVFRRFRNETKKAWYSDCFQPNIHGSKKRRRRSV